VEAFRFIKRIFYLVSFDADVGNFENASLAHSPPRLWRDCGEIRYTVFSPGPLWYPGSILLKE
jgi:hypothetical protein